AVDLGFRFARIHSERLTIGMSPEQPVQPVTTHTEGERSRMFLYVSAKFAKSGSPFDHSSVREREKVHSTVKRYLLRYTVCCLKPVICVYTRNL
ncbi:hypothetical protein BaRGS_00030341, partial [Batillaria attramentaria]